jgi:hypothetical protein
MESEKTDDHDHLIDSVRAAFSQHSEAHADPQAETLHQPGEVEHQREADQRSIDMGLAVTAKLNDEDRRGEQSKPARDFRGRFTSTSATTGVDVAAGALHVPEAPAAAPPSSWSPEAKALYNDLPQPIRDAIAKREAEVSQGFSQYRDRTQSAAQIEQMMAPRRQAFQQYGMKSDAEAIERLLLVSDGMAQNPAGTLAFLSQQFDVGPQQIFPGMQSSQQVETIIAQRVQLALAQAEVQRFEQRAPEHYGLVKSLMGQLLQSGAASSMADAYKLAIAQHPAVQSIEKQRRDRERREQRIRAADASLSGAPHGISETPPRSNGRSSNGKFGDIADDVRAAMNAHL